MAEPQEFASEYAKAERLAAQADHWRTTLAGAPALLELPTDRPRPAAQDFAGARAPIRLDAELTLGLKRLAQRHGATLFTTLLAAWSVVLGRLSGQDDLVIGTPSANRGRRETEDLVGFFVNTLALRIGLGDDPSVGEVIARARKAALEAQDNQDLPFEQVVEIVQPPRSLNHSPLFQVMFTWQNNTPAELALADVQAIPVRGAAATAKFDLDLNLAEQGEVIAGSLGYATALFDAATVERHIGYLVTLLKAMVADDQQRALRIDLLDTAERTLLLETWNATEAAYPDQACVHQLFEAQVQADPDATALVYEDTSLTYGELNARANKLAHHLIGLGVRPDDRVAICVERSLEMVVGLIAILKAGAAYVPLDPAYPAERLAFMLGDTTPVAVLTHAATSRVLDEAAAAGLQPAPTILDLVADQALWADQPDTDTDPAALGLTPGHLAYVIYTSGSTGTPKGVMVEHRGVVNLARWQRAFFGLETSRRISQLAAFGFDGAVGETMMALLNGGVLCIIRRDNLDAPALTTAMNELAIDVVVLIPSMLRLLDPEAFTGGRPMTVVSVGEECTPDLASRWSQRCTFINGYGPTECTVYSHALTVDAGASSGRRIAIGQPISNLRSYILDAQMRPVPSGTVGEMYLGGVGLARGYLNRPELTAERFVPNPFRQAAPPIRPLDLATARGDINSLMPESPGPPPSSRRALPQPASVLRSLSDIGLSELAKQKLVAWLDGDDATRASLLRYMYEGQVEGRYRSAGINRDILGELLGTSDLRGLHGVDLGAGNGEILTVLEEMGAQVVGCDFVPHFVEGMRRRGQTAKLVKVDVGREEFLADSGLGAHSQDFALSTLVLDRIADPLQMLSNLFATLKPGGRFAVQTLLPIVPVDDGPTDTPIVYTPPDKRIVTSADVDANVSEVFQRLTRLGGDDIRIFTFPYCVASTDGVQLYTVWSFCGRATKGRAPASVYDRLYRTGDLGRYLPDGNIEFLGRNDHQVKIRGFRIELGEIDARLSDHPAVREAVVLARTDEAGDKRLVAYVTADDPDAATAEALRAHLAASLPDYMVPAAYVRLDTLPLTPNGKLDRKALPAPDGEAFARRAYEAPQGEVEETLAAIWAELLGLERISRHDNFFELGGHSLLAIRMMARLRQSGLPAEVRSLFVAPTLADLASTLTERPQPQVAAPPNPISPDTQRLTPDLLPLIDLTQADIDRIVAAVPGGLPAIQDIYALSPLQEGMLFHHLLSEADDPYVGNDILAFADRAALDRYIVAAQQVVDRHDILRTGFHWQGLTTPAQVVQRHAALQVTEVTLPPEAGPATERLRARFDRTRSSLDISRPPLVQFAIAFDADHDRWLLLRMHHHLIGDHSTFDILRSEAAAILRGEGAGLARPQPFRNLIAQARLGLPAEEHERFFRAMLGDIDEPTTPFGLRDVRGDGHHLSEAHRPLPQALNDRLRAQARRLGVSLASLCHLAWGQVVARTSGREAVVFGTVLFGRMDAGEGADTAMGMFLNTLPLRLDLDGTGVEAAVRQTHARLAELLRHEHASLAMAQRCSGIDPQSPLFSALFNYRHNEPHRGGAVKAADATRSLGGEERTNYPFVLSIEDNSDALGASAQVRGPVEADRVCGYMQTALESLAEALEHAPTTPVRRLEVLPADERTLLLETWNATEAAYPDQACVHQLFEAQAARDPDATALVYEDTSLTYGELNARANKLAHHLIGLGVRPDDRVAICVERSLEMVVGLMAILKAGAAYVPLDPAYPAERLGFMLGDSAPALVLTHDAARQALDQAMTGLEAAPPILDLVADQALWADQPDTDPAALGLTPANLAYVIYTSGSTGTPKGVMVEHRNLVNHTVWFNRVHRLDGADVVLQRTPFSFDASVWEFFSTLTSGAGLRLASGAATADLDALQRDLLQGVTRVQCVPLLLNALLEAKAFERASALRAVFCGGDALPVRLGAALRAQGPARLVNLYGPTEATIDSVVGTYEADLPAKDGSIPIGRPIANTRLYLLDAELQPVPLGAVGEIHIGGAGVARGYLNRPELTAEKFIKSPFVEGDRLYRTGDLGRYLPDGNIEFLGRNDHQVKIRGFRIELGEIEARLTDHPAVREAVVLARTDEAGDKRLVAYVTADDPEAATAEALRAHLAASLPDYMVPAAYVRLDALPLTPNGKLDRKALPAPDGEAFARQAYEAPQGEVEETLAAIWAELLGLERISRHDNFFELGGHSLLAVRMINEASSQGIRVRLATLFEAPTLSDVAGSTDAFRTPSPSNAVIPIRRTGAEPPIFFTPTGMGGYNYVAQLALEFDSKWPLYALNWQHNGDPLPTSLEALAGRMIRSIKAVQPCGPYRLMGYSSGGILAYAIAKRLVENGEAVAYLGLIEVGLPRNRPKRLPDPRTELFRSLNTEPTGAPEPLNRRSPVSDLLSEARSRGLVPPWMEEAQWRRMVRFAGMALKYDAAPVSLRIHQFNAKTAPEHFSPNLGWEAVAAPRYLRLAKLPGDHASIVQDDRHRRRLVARILKTLEDAAE